MKLEDYPVSAVICSTNDDGNKKQNEFIDLECDFNLRSDLFSSIELNTNLRLVCPKYCSADSSPIYGSGMYTDNSSICKAAIHAGVITDMNGGIFELNVEPGRKNYLGSSSHNIDSLDYPDEWDKSFKVKKYNPYCPIDKMKEFMKANSFIELESNVGNKSQFVDLFKEFVENTKQQKQPEIVQKNENTNSNQNKNSLVIDNKSLTLLSNFFSFIQSKESKTEKSKLKQKFLKKNFQFKENNFNPLLNATIENNSKSVIKKSGGLFGGNSSPSSEMTTQEAILSLNKSKDKERTQISEIQNVGTGFKTIIGKTSSQVNILQLDKELGLNNQKMVYTTLKRKIVDIHKKISEIVRKSKQKVSRMEHLLKIDKSHIDNFLIRDQFNEDYLSKSILDNYDIVNNKKGVGEPSKWDYYMYNQDGHSKTIAQKESFIDSKSGSHLVIKNRDLYDFELRFSVLIKDSNTFGIAFRYKDPYNYYIVELSKQEKGIINIINIYLY